MAFCHRENPRAQEASTLPVQGSPKSPAPAASSEALTLQLHAEEVSVSRRMRPGQTVRVSTVTHQREQIVDEALTNERVEIERVPVGREVSAPPPPRDEGDVTVISVVEEMVFVQRRLILKEEVRIRKVRVTDRHRETVTLREQEAVITRTGPETPAGQADQTTPTQPAQEQQP